MSNACELIESTQYIRLIVNLVKHAHTLLFPVGIHVDMSVYYTFKPVSNWCHGKLHEFSEKTVVPV